VARVRLREQPQGKIVVNGRDMEEYFPGEQDRSVVRQPLQTVELLGSVGCMVRVEGGGLTGQAGAVRLGIARALVRLRPDLETRLRDAGHLTRDSRMKERKKYGRKGARKSFQFSKR
jgi:small subunit ribosomal protein S9